MIFKDLSFSYIPRLQLSKTELYILSFLSIIIFCTSGTVDSLKLYTLLLNTDNIPYYYERITWLIMPISFLLSWGIFATVFYLAALTLGGSQNQSSFYCYSAISLNLGTIIFLLQIWQANSLSEGSLNSDLIKSATVYWIKAEGIASNFLIALANIICVHKKLGLTWLKSLSSIAIPIAIIVFLSNYIF